MSDSDDRPCCECKAKPVVGYAMDRKGVFMYQAVGINAAFPLCEDCFDPTPTKGLLVWRKGDILPFNWLTSEIHQEPEPDPMPPLMDFDAAMRQMDRLVTGAAREEGPRSFREALVAAIEEHSRARDRTDGAEEYVEAACFLLGYRKAAVTSFVARTRDYWGKWKNDMANFDAAVEALDAPEDGR